MTIGTWIKKILAVFTAIYFFTASLFVGGDIKNQDYGQVDSKSSTLTAQEINETSEWFENNILCVLNGKTPAFSFTYGGRDFGKHLDDWQIVLDSDVTEGETRNVSITAAHLKDTLSVTCEAVLFTEHSNCEWTLYFTNTGTKNTQVLKNILPLNSTFENTGADTPVLHYSNGSKHVETDAFMPMAKTLPAGIQRTFGTGTVGRASYDYLPFFNMDMGNSGVIASIGWLGNWKASFKNSFSQCVEVKIGQKSLKGALYAGETVRSPLVNLQFYSGNVLKGQNLFRKFLNDCYYTQNNQRQLLCSGSQEYDLMTYATIDNQLAALDTMVKYNVPADCFWMDAGWYEGCDDPNSAWYSKRGGWNIDSDRFPEGLKPLSDACDEQGIDNVLWFEPETVNESSEFYQAYRNWLIDCGSSALLWNFADDEAAEFMTNYISSKIKEYGVDVYRQDFNINPNDYWNHAKYTGEKRKGFFENKYIINFYKFWDYLLADNQGLIIDNCASGGSRICMETIKRSVVLWRNDDCYEPIGEQSRTYGLSYWLPLSGSGTLMSGYMDYTQSYEFRSSMSGTLICVYPYSNIAAGNNEEAKLLSGLNLIGQYLDIREYYLKDYYPLTPYSIDKDSIVAFQYNDNDDLSGIVMAYRRDTAKDNAVAVKLNGLDVNSTYILENIDTGEFLECTGKQLMDTVTLSLPNPAAAYVFKYHTK